MRPAPRCAGGGRWSRRQERHDQRDRLGGKGALRGGRQGGGERVQGGAEQGAAQGLHGHGGSLLGDARARPPGPRPGGLRVCARSSFRVHSSSGTDTGSRASVSRSRAWGRGRVRQGPVPRPAAARRSARAGRGCPRAGRFRAATAPPAPGPIRRRPGGAGRVVDLAHIGHGHLFQHDDAARPRRPSSTVAAAWASSSASVIRASSASVTKATGSSPA